MHIAVIGAGPAGYYTAETLAAHPGTHIDILDRLPTPYGLIRAGVAPDHQSIKKVSARFEKTNIQERVRFVGHLDVGTDVSIAELSELYDAVVLATGAAKDRPLNIAGEALPGVIGSAPFVGWYNSHPDYRHLKPDLDVASAVIIGAGNVALDVARVLAKTATEMASSDIAPFAERRIEASPLSDIYIVARRGPADAKFSPKELAEMAELEKFTAVLDAESAATLDAGLPDLPTTTRKNIGIFQAMAQEDWHDKTPFRLHFRFWRKPLKIIGEDCVCGIELAHTRMEGGKLVETGPCETIPTGLIIPCIGYRTVPIKGIPYDEDYGHFQNDGGHIAGNIYCAGWARRGPTGTIGTNKPDGAEVAARIITDLTSVRGPERSGRAGLDALIAERGLNVNTFREWKNIEAAEEKAATGGAPRVKMTDMGAMLDIAHGKVKQEKPAS